MIYVLSKKTKEKKQIKWDTLYATHIKYMLYHRIQTMKHNIEECKLECFSNQGDKKKIIMGKAILIYKYKLVTWK